jgi:hypothetical protein
MPRLPNCGHQLHPHLLKKRVFVAQRNKHKKAIHDGWPALRSCLLSCPSLCIWPRRTPLCSRARVPTYLLFIELCGCLHTDDASTPIQSV